MIKKLKNLGVTVKQEKESGVWFDLSNVELNVKVPKIRGTGYKSDNI
jgi:hypothetical protein